MIDLATLGNTIATENNIELLRGIFPTLLGEVRQRHETLEGLDPIAVPVFTKEEVDRARGQLGSIHSLDVMRRHAQDVFKGLQRLDEQIARARGRR